VKNEHFNPNGTVPPEEYRLPFPDNHLDDVIAYSIFTHLQTLKAAQNYMSEIKRVLKPGGKLFVTWYRSPPDPVANEWIGRTVYNEWDIINMLNGFNCISTYGGHSSDYYDQWALFCQKL
jgi:ubiquinone/menaquinone biosynthesis C-methylase UbiE